MQKSPAIALFLFIIVHSATSQTGPTFNSFLHRIESEDTSRRAAIADSFMTARRPKGFPIAEDSMAFFIYRGKVDSTITVTGDYTQWSANGDPMTNISATNLYYVGKKFEPDARIDYKFIKDGNWMLDPLNPHTIKGGFGQNSELAMPSYVQPVEIQYNPAIPHGTISSFIFTSVPPATAGPSWCTCRPATRQRHSDIRHSTFMMGPIIYHLLRWQTCWTI